MREHSDATKRMAKTLGAEFVPKLPVTPDKVSSVSERVELTLVEARQFVEAYKPEDAQDRDGMESMLRDIDAAIEALRSSAPRTSEDAEKENT